MSWNGAHPRATRAEVRRLLPPAACKRCVYWFRVWWPELDKVASGYAGYRCPRCGIDWGDAAAAIMRTLADSQLVALHEPASDLGRSPARGQHSRWWHIATVAFCFAAFGTSIAERIRLLRLKMQPIEFQLPHERQPTEEEQALWHRSVAEKVRAMTWARTNADLALMAGLSPLLGELLWAVLQRRRT